MPSDAEQGHSFCHLSIVVITKPLFRFEVAHRQCVSQTGPEFEYPSDQIFLSTPPVYAVGLDEDDMNKPQVR